MRDVPLNVQGTGTAASISGKSKSVSFGARFWLTMLYLILEYARPQEIIPGLSSLRVSGIVVGLLGVLLLTCGRLVLNDTQTKLFITFLGWMSLGVFFAVNDRQAFNVTLAMLFTFVAYLAIITFVDSFEKFQAMVSVWICTHVFLAVEGIKRRGMGIGGFVADENDLALVLNMIIPIILFLLFDRVTISKRIWFLIIISMLLFCDLLTFSGAGFLGLLRSVCIAGYGHRES